MNTSEIGKTMWNVAHQKLQSLHLSNQQIKQGYRVDEQTDSTTVVQKAREKACSVNSIVSGTMNQITKVIGNIF